MMERRVGVHFLFLALLSAATSEFAAAAPGAPILESFQLNPDWNWQTIETDHFRITYDQPLADVARRASVYLEEAHRLLTPVMQHSPRWKTQVVVTDNTDISNGGTSGLYRFGMVLQITPPGPNSAIGYFNQWLRLLCLHEYVHTLHLDTADGIWDVLGWATGATIFGMPNHALPPWMLEGYAVYLETIFSKRGFGRGASPYFEMVVRASVENGTLDTAEYFTLDRLHVETPVYPGAEARYLFGYSLIQELVDSFGDPSVLGAASHANTPFFLDLMVSSPNFPGWQGLWKQWVEKAKSRHGAELAKLRSGPKQSFEPLTAPGYDPQALRASQDGKWIAFEDTSIDRVTHLSVLNLDTQKVRRYARAANLTGMAFVSHVPGEVRGLVYSDGRQLDNYHFFNDLFFINLDSEESYELTHGQRAQYPDVNAAGDRIVYVQNQGGRTWLTVADLLISSAGRVQLRNARTLWTPPGWDQVHSPRFSPDGSRVVFVVRPETREGSDLFEISLQDPAARPILSDGSFNRFPAFESNSRLLFVSDKSGVDNAYVRDLGRRESRALTNFTTGIWNLDVAQGRYFGSVYRSLKRETGWTLSEWRPLDASVPAPPKVLIPRPKSPEGLGAAQDFSWTESPTPLLPSLWPRTWTPGFFFSSLTTQIQLNLQGYHATDTFIYQLTPLFDSRTGSLFANAKVTVQTLAWFWSLQGISWLNWASATSIGVVYERQNDVVLSATKLWPGTFSTLQLDLFATLSQAGRYNASAGHAAVADSVSPVTPTPVFPTLGAVLSFSDTAASRWGIQSELGTAASVALQHYFLLTEAPVLKFTAGLQPFFEILDHWVASPYASYSIATRVPSTSAAQVRLFNRRGYRTLTVPAQSLGLLGLQTDFPLLRIYRGVGGIVPLGMRSVSAYVYGETSFFPLAEPGTAFLPTVGFGLKFGIAVPPASVALTTEVEYGLLQNFGGGLNWSVALQF